MLLFIILKWNFIGLDPFPCVLLISREPRWIIVQFRTILPLMANGKFEIFDFKNDFFNENSSCSWILFIWLNLKIHVSCRLSNYKNWLKNYEEYWKNDHISHILTVSFYDLIIFKKHSSRDFIKWINLEISINLHKNTRT